MRGGIIIFLKLWTRPCCLRCRSQGNGRHTHGTPEHRNAMMLMAVLDKNSDKQVPLLVGPQPLPLAVQALVPH